MSSRPTRNSRVSHRQEIPANLILNWQSSGAKPLVRRPKTACERCRTAKIKCHGDGQHECDRCNKRGLPCKYTQPAPSPSLASSRSRPAPDLTTQKEIHMDFSTDSVDQFGGDNAAFQELLGSSVGWSNMNNIHPLESSEQQPMDWGAVDPVLDWTPGMSPPTSLDPSGLLPSTSTTPSNTSAIATGHTPISEQQRSLSSLGLFPLITNTTAVDLSWQNQLTSQSCQCRKDLALLVPNARAALQERRLDAVCQVTGDVIQQCQDIVSCQGCNVNCTDLICIMAVFQEADFCFDFIAKGDIDGVISVSMGSYEMVVDEQDAKHWRRMLVIQLVRRANELLNSISARGQDMLKDLDPGCRLGRVNIDYLQAVIGNSRENFHRIMKRFQDEETTVE